MKVFREMVSLVTKQQLNKIDVIDYRQSLVTGNLYQQLFNGISDETFTTDEQAASALYQTSPSDKKYQMLKSRLKDRLVNTLFFINHKKIQESAYQQAVYQCNRNYFCAKLLLTHGARTSAIAMARNTLSQAEKFDLNEIAFLCARMLRHHYSMAGLKKEYQHYHNIVTESLKKVRGENRAEFMYGSLVAQFGRSKAIQPELEQTAKDYFNQCKELAKYQHTFHLTILHYRVGMLYYQIIGNYRLLLNLCNRLQQYSKNHPKFYVASREGEVSLLKMVCCLHLRNFKLGKQNAEEALQRYKKGSNNWFVVLENYFMLATHAGKFEKASLIVEEAMHHQRFQFLSPEKHETWKIYEAYINYLVPGEQKTKDFKILKFLNEVPIYSKDKAGFYPAILIAQILYIIDRGDEDKLERTIESLRVFSSRYLSGKKAPRTTLFIKMLRQLVNYNYDPKKVKIRAAPYLEKLKAVGKISSEEIDSMEIIPYETAWSIILSRLENNKEVHNKLPYRSS
ncbi:MAG TPA: hypothetical protein VE978_25385 [Chitinophagales bacterium]|nr:hypothetical protein [Chitinophagales bacterium]